MRVLLQRVSEAAVTVDGEVVGEIGPGYVALVGIAHEDGERELEWMAKKVRQLRVFEDEQGRMNRSLDDVAGSVLAVSQFTLYAGMRKGRRPDFLAAADPPIANQRFERFVELLRQASIPVATGRFGAMMRVSLVNEGPATFWLDSETLLHAPRSS